MAERSFKRSPAIAHRRGRRVPRRGHPRGHKALLQSGVGYVAGYQGSPISHLMDVLADANEILQELGVHFEASASEATAAATLAASVMYPIRGAVTWKSTVGTNVASDALANLASGGVTGGALVIVGEDYGEGSSIMQERSHAFAMKSQIWLLDPRPNLESMVKAVEDGFSLSEASKTPVMLQLRIRGCHVHGRFIARKTSAPPSAWRRRWKARRATPAASCCRPRPSCTSRKRSATAGPPPSAISGTQAQRAFRRRPVRHRPDPAGRPVQRRHPRAAAAGPGRPLRQQPHPAVRHERDLPRHRGRGHRLLPRQARRAAARGRPARLHRAEPARGAAQGRHRHAALGQGRAAHGRRVHHPGHARGPARIPAPQPPESLQTHPAVAADAAAASAAQPRSSRSRARGPPDPSSSPSPSTSMSRADGGSAAAPGRLLYRLPRAPDLLGADAGAGNAGPAPYFLRHRLPPVLDPAALQPGRHHHGLRLGASSAAAFNVPAAKRPISIMGDGGFCTTACPRASATPCSTSTTASSSSSTTTTRRPPAAGHPVRAPRTPTAPPTTHRPRRARVGVQWVRTLDRTYDVAKVRATIEEALTTDVKAPRSSSRSPSAC